ncbi:transmembrane and coiled-coil domain-containing protein 4 [Anabrus simplex]|uniref:transmembrane and coiled-coil domain-containing protein 4 n=1 Tax=Anabrus simplex TaxID=316456 RepID=UPI0035A31BF9
METVRDNEPKLIKKKQLEDPDRVLSSTFKDLQKTVNLGTLLSDAGIYSLAAICALALNELFNDEWDMPFNHRCIRLLLEHLKLPKQVESVMFSLVDGQASQTPDAYIDLLLNEPALKGNALLVVQDLVLLSVREGKYDARMRVLIKHLAWLLMVPQHLVDLYEESVVECLSDETTTLSEEQQKEVDKRQRKKRLKRYALIGLATVGGGTLLGLTGGLAAPLIGAGVGSILGGATAAAIGSSAGIAIIGSLFGVAGAGLTGFKMKKRVGEIEEFAFGFLSPEPEEDIESETDSVGTPSEKEATTSEKTASTTPTVQQLHITIAISGWLTDDREDNFTRPWKTMLSSREQYYLRYESTYLLELGKAMELVLSFAVSMAAQEALKYTILSGLISAVTWPASLMTLASVIDNPWGVCCRRSAEVGKQLAEVLLAREQGQRPVTLIGFSLGARVIYYCLREMSQRKDCEGIIEDAILLGTPVSGSPKDWEKLMRVVSGKIVNGYCKSDWLLKFLYRTLSISNDVAGLQPIECKNRRMCNINLSEIVSGHSEYPDKIGAILKIIGVRTHEDATELEAKLTKSSSDLPGCSPTKRRQSTSLLALRPSKSDNTIHFQSSSASLEGAHKQPIDFTPYEGVEIAEEVIASSNSTSVNNSKSSTHTQEQSSSKIIADESGIIEEVCEEVKESLTCK